jgi:hypothetical protein
MFFQIHKSGRAIDGSSYSSLEEAVSVLEKAEQGGEVVEVDAADRIVRRFTLQECRKVRRVVTVAASSG